MDYNRLADAYSRGRSVSQLVIEELTEKAAQHKWAEVLEIGCGTATHVQALAKAIGCLAFGLDPSLEMVKHALGSNVHLTVGRAEMMPFTANVFDLVFSKDVVHHIQDTSAYFSESLRLLVPGGHICTATDSADHIRRRRPLSVYWPSTTEADLRRYPSIQTLREQMKRAGFTGIQVNEKEMEFALADLKPYRERSFSCLHLISDEEFDAGLRALERDFEKGSVKGITLYTFLWGRKP